MHNESADLKKTTTTVAAEYNKPIWLAFVDYENAFDWVEFMVFIYLFIYLFFIFYLFTFFFRIQCAIGKWTKQHVKKS